MDWLASTLNWIYPHHCVLCGERGEALCQRCSQELPPLGLACHHCALPLTNNNGLCGQCLKRMPPYDRAIAALQYKEAAGELVLAFKNGGNRQAGQILAEKLIDVCRQAPRPTLIIPVPLHRKRLAERGFNQAGVLAQQLGRALNIAVDHHCARRERDTEKQKGLDAKARRKNLNKAFTIQSQLRGHIAIVDDVVTTGATVNAISRAARKAGAEEISIWCAARTPNATKG